MNLLDVSDLSVEFSTSDGVIKAVNHLNLSIGHGDTLAIVGESGSGKSQSAFAMLGLLDENGHASGSVKFKGEEILNAPDTTLNKIRAEGISMVFQDPMSSLNPYMKIADQMSEILTYHQGMNKGDALRECVRMLDAVKIPDASNRIGYYPHEFSGGMRQRVMIAMSLLCKPDLLIADEPTTALDVTVQAQIMSLFGELRREFNMALLLITHDLGIVAGSCEQMMVMYAGGVMEQGPVTELFEKPRHPYTIGLLNSIVRIDQANETLHTIPGSPPNMLSPPQGCPFHERCAYAIDPCRQQFPPLVAESTTRSRACHVNPAELT